MPISIWHLFIVWQIRRYFILYFMSRKLPEIEPATLSMVLLYVYLRAYHFGYMRYIREAVSSISEPLFNLSLFFQLLYSFHWTIFANRIIKYIDRRKNFGVRFVVVH